MSERYLRISEQAREFIYSCLKDIDRVRTDDLDTRGSEFDDASYKLKRSADAIWRLLKDLEP